MRLLFASLAVVLALLPLKASAESYDEAQRLIESGQMTEGMCMMADLVRSGDSKARTLNDALIREGGDGFSADCLRWRTWDAEEEKACDWGSSGTEDDPGFVAVLRLGVSVGCLLGEVIDLFSE